MKATKEIPIYLSQKRNVRQIDVVQHDTGIQLVFSVLDFAIPSGATATLYVQKPSGKFVYQEDGITVIGNTVTVDLHNQAITEHGKVPYQVSLKSGSDVITTFTGLIMVEKSLKDAGATESRTVIRAFDEAVSAHVAEFQAKAEEIVAACIATIPEDYTELAAKVNETANAVKGYLSGAVVFADDVSPVEHSPVVKVRGKNLVNVADVEISNFAGYHSPIALNFEVKVGKTYTLSFDVQSNVEPFIASIGFGSKEAYYVDAVYGANQNSGRVVLTVTPSEKMLTNGSYIHIRAPRYSEPKNYTATISNIQLEEGTVATDYEPYIDPSTVTVKRTSKNLIDRELMKSEATLNGVTITRSGDSITLNGTLTVDSVLFSTAFCLFGGVGNYYNLSYKHLGGTVEGSASVCVGDSEAFDSARQSWANIKMQNNDNNYSYPMTKPFIKDLWFYAVAGAKFTNYRIQIQLESGKKATEFETCNGVEYIPTADGTVPGITSLSPSMTILTDTEGVIVECEYNRDANKVIEKLTNAIKALGGTI